MAHELSDIEYLGMIRGEIVWNHRDERWERRDFDPSHPWWKLGIDRTGVHPATPVPLPRNHRPPTIPFRPTCRLGPP